MTSDDDTISSQMAELIRQAKHFCAYQERCSSEVIQKLATLGADEHQQKIVMDALLKEAYVDNKRFANVYAQGKYKNNQWGRIKIFLELTRRGIPNDIITQAIDGINEDEYIQILQHLIEKKMHTLKYKHPQQAMERTAYFCTGKGFEPELVWQLIKKHDFKS
jgi:regulatory protein